MPTCSTGSICPPGHSQSTPSAADWWSASHHLAATAGSKSNTDGVMSGGAARGGRRSRKPAVRLAGGGRQLGNRLPSSSLHPGGSSDEVGSGRRGCGLRSSSTAASGGRLPSPKLPVTDNHPMPSDDHYKLETNCPSLQQRGRGGENSGAERNAVGGHMGSERRSRPPSVAPIASPQRGPPRLMSSHSGSYQANGGSQQTAALNVHSVETSATSHSSANFVFRQVNEFSRPGGVVGLPVGGREVVASASHLMPPPPPGSSTSGSDQHRSSSGGSGVVYKRGGFGSKKEEGSSFRVESAGGGGGGSSSNGVHHGAHGHQSHHGSVEAGQHYEWQTQFFKTKLCPYHKEGRCINGTDCRFAHNAVELRSLPDLRRTKLCDSYVRKEECRDPMCPFAHSPSELRTSSHTFYKVTLCNFYKKGKCWNGVHCRFAHGISELRVPIHGKFPDAEGVPGQGPGADSTCAGDEGNTAHKLAPLMGIATRANEIGALDHSKVGVPQQFGDSVVDCQQQALGEASLSIYTKGASTRLPQSNVQRSNSSNRSSQHDSNSRVGAMHLVSSGPPGASNSRPIRHLVNGEVGRNGETGGMASDSFHRHSAAKGNMTSSPPPLYVVEEGPTVTQEAERRSSHAMGMEASIGDDSNGSKALMMLLASSILQQPQFQMASPDAWKLPPGPSGTSSMFGGVELQNSSSNATSDMTLTDLSAAVEALLASTGTKPTDETTPLEAATPSIMSPSMEELLSTWISQMSLGQDDKNERLRLLYESPKRRRRQDSNASALTLEGDELRSHLLASLLKDIVPNAAGGGGEESLVDDSSVVPRIPMPSSSGTSPTRRVGLLADVPVEESNKTFSVPSLGIGFDPLASSSSLWGAGSLGMPSVTADLLSFSQLCGRTLPMTSSTTMSTSTASMMATTATGGSVDGDTKEAGVLSEVGGNSCVDQLQLSQNARTSESVGHRSLCSSSSVHSMRSLSTDDEGGLQVALELRGDERKCSMANNKRKEEDDDETATHNGSANQPPSSLSLATAANGVSSFTARFSHAHEESVGMTATRPSTATTAVPSPAESWKASLVNSDDTRHGSRTTLNNGVYSSDDIVTAAIMSPSSSCFLPGEGGDVGLTFPSLELLSNSLNESHQMDPTPHCGNMTLELDHAIALESNIHPVVMPEGNTAGDELQFPWTSWIQQTSPCQEGKRETLNSIFDPSTIASILSCRGQAEDVLSSLSVSDASLFADLRTSTTSAAVSSDASLGGFGKVISCRSGEEEKERGGLNTPGARRPSAVSFTRPTLSPSPPLGVHAPHTPPSFTTLPGAMGYADGCLRAQTQISPGAGDVRVMQHLLYGMQHRCIAES